MRSSCNGWLLRVCRATSRRRVVSWILLLATLTGSSGSGLTLEARDKEPRKVRKESAQQERPQSSQPAAGDSAPVREKIALKSSDTASLAAGEIKTSQPLDVALDAIRSSRDTLRKLPGYTCTFTKQEQLKKNSLTTQSMAMKFRREPFSVYLKSIDPNPGRQVLFVEGRNDGKFHFREASGLLSYMGTISLLPTSSDAMKENRYPITMIGMEKMLEVYILDWEQSLKHPDTQVQIVPQVKIGNVDCRMFEVVHPQQREPFKFYKGRVYLDKKANLPIRAEQFAFPAKAGKEPQLVEQYNYLDVKPVNAPAEKDFDVKNEKYGLK